MKTFDYIAPLSKKQLAFLMKISNTTLQFYLNNDWYDELKAIGYKKERKVLSPLQISFVEEQWGELDYSLLSTNSACA